MRGIVKGGNNDGSRINGVIESYVVDTGETITVGDFVKFVNGGGVRKATNDDPVMKIPTVFESAYSNDMCAVQIDTNKVLVAYQDAVNSSYGTACVVTVSASTVSAGTPVVFESAVTAYISIDKVTTDKAIVAFRGATNYGRSVILSVSGTTITVGTVVNFNLAATGYCSIALVNTDKAVVAYNDNGASYNSVVITISGITLTVGAEFVIVATNSSGAIAKIDIDKAIAVYSGVSNYPQLAVLSVSGTTLSRGTAVVIESLPCYYFAIAQININKAIAVFNSNNTALKAIAMSISGTTITVGVPIALCGEGSAYFSICADGDSKARIVFRDSGGYANLTDLSISTNTLNIMYNSKIVQGNTLKIIKLETSKFLFPYTRNGDNYGVSAVIDDEIKSNGVAKTGGTAGQTIQVYTG